MSEGVWNHSPEKVSSLIYIDKDGYINATRTGVYQLEYTFAIGEKTDEKEGEYDIERCTVNTFTALVCVYEGDEDKFEPLPDDPKKIPDGYYSEDTVNYIMTKDITWKAEEFWTVGNFNGTLINPNGYTLTWDITADSAYYDRRRQVEAIFGNNYGYIDGLKVKIVSDEKKTVEIGDFYGLVERNHGVLQNCTIEGTVYIGNLEQHYAPTHFYALPQHGFSFNNQARMTVYSNSSIYAYETTGLRESDIAERCWQSKNNKVYLDAWYYQNEVKAQRRAVPTIEATESNSNVCEHLVYGKAGEEEKAVTLQVPYMADKAGEKNYMMSNWTVKENSPLEIDMALWETIRWSHYSQSDYNNLDVKYWLVNGERVDSLNDIVVTEDVRIEPFVQYKATQIYKRDGSLYSLGFICNAEETLRLNDSSEEERTVSLYDLACMLRDPRCVIPASIYVGKNYNAKTVMMTQEQGAMPFLLNYLQEGGELSIDNENPYVSFIGGKSFCNAQGTELYFYFEGKGETEITLHPQIEKISNANAFWNGENYRKLNLTNVKELNQQIGDSLPNLREINLGKELVKITGGNSAGDTVNHFLRRMPYLSKVEVDESHPTLRAKDNFVYEESLGISTLLYAPSTLKGEVDVPDGIMKLNGDCFNGSDIQHLIFPDSLTEMNMAALAGMKSLEKITFGASDRIIFHSKTELPALTSVVFNGTRNIDGESTVFMYANVDTIELPKELESFIDIFIDCKAYQVSEENNIWKSVDGVLYNKQENTLAMYPKKKEGDSYTVLDGTNAVGKNAFYETKLKSVLFPDACTQISDFAFNGSNVESVIFKAKGRIEIKSNAFFGCENLSNVSVSTDATLAIGGSAFRACVNLKEFPYENVVDIGSSAFKETGIEYFEIGENVFMGVSAFENSQIKRAVIKSTTLSYIHSMAFKNTPLESVELSPSVTYIEESAFMGCKNLKSIDLTNVRFIRAHAFAESGLESVESETVETLDESAFAGCESLERVDLPNVLTVTVGAFSASGVKIANLPSANRVEESAFADCEELVYISLADGVSLKAYAFMNCIRLEELPFTVSAVGHQTFSGCTALKKATVQGNVRDVTQTLVFENCTALEEVTIVGEIVEIGASFFSGCTSLKKVFITHTGTENGTVSATAFDLTADAEVYLNVPESFLWKGKIPANITVYVSTECVETFRSEWLANESQIKGYDFSNQENE